MRHLRAWGARRREVWVWSPAARVLGLCILGPRLDERKGGRRPPEKSAQCGDARAPKYSGFITVSPLRGAPAAAADARALLLGRGRLGGCHALLLRRGRRAA